MHLNRAQDRACRSKDGPALIVAGAGTGKTHTLTERLVYLIEEKKIHPENILALTFTNKASREMKERAEEKLGKGSLTHLFLGTFHQLGLRILRQEIRKAGLNPDFLIYNRIEQEGLVREILRGRRKNLNLSVPKIVEKISILKKNLILSGEKISDPYISLIVETYQNRLKEKNALDFDDLILLPISIFKKYPDVLARYQEIFTYILVDEYQDIDQAQYELLKMLSLRHRNLWAIGDSDQAIYSFRGGNLQNFLEFKRDYPEAELITLKENYRSSEVIIKASQALIEKNTNRMKKELSATIKEGENISLWIVPDEKAEGRTIISEIERQLGGTSHYEIYRGGNNLGENLCHAQSFSDFAVLYRLHSQGQALAKIFEESGIPYQVVESSRKTDIKDTDIDNALLQDIDFFDERADAVILMTLHAAKGLEFPIVFITGLEQGILPYSCGQEADTGEKEELEDYEEERRLLYVGITRAKRKLYLLFTKNRVIYGERKSNLPSPFIKELPENLLEKRELYLKKRKSRDRQLTLWNEKGDRLLFSRTQK